MELKTELNVISKLIYLWAFVEGGLGGIMHLFHIPLKGFVIGGFSILINILIAKYSRLNVKTMFSALGFVLLAKFSLSPHSPPGAYFAVCFQGILAILIFKLFDIRLWSIYLYSGICMLENAIQKPFMAYLIYGKELVNGILIAVNKFFNNIETTELVLYTLIALYFLIYLIWGLLIAYWGMQFLKRLETYKLPKELQSIDKTLPAITKKAKFKITSLIGFSLISFFVLFYFADTGANWMMYLLKVIVWIVFLSIILPFFIRLVLQYFKKKKESKVREILIEIPEVRNRFRWAYQLSKEKKGLQRIQEFLFLGLYLNIFYQEERNCSEE